MRQIGNYDEARAATERAQAQCADDDYKNLGRIFHIYMQFESDHDNYDAALEYCKQSVEFYKMSKIADRIAHSIRHMADLQRRLEQYAESEKHYREALEIYKDDNETQAGDLANALRGFSLVLEKREKMEEAIAAWEETRNAYGVCNLQEGVDEATSKINELQSMS